MATQSFYIGPNREENGNQVVTYGFTYKELSQLTYAIDELIAYHRMWADDDRPCVVQDALQSIDFLTELGNKVDWYRNKALENKEEVVEEE